MGFYSFQTVGLAILRLCFKVYALIVDGAFFTVNLLKGSGQRVDVIRDPLLLIPASVLAQKIAKGEIRSEYVVQAYISRIREVQPVINALCDERFKDAIEDAKRVDQMVQSGEKTEKELLDQYPFLGVPLSLKNSVSVKDMCLSLGLVARKNIKADQDSKLVEFLRKSGAIPVVVTNVPSYLLAWETFNNAHGMTKNPHNTNWTAAGSSGGEAALIASGGSVLGVGTDLVCSVRLPALFNGIFGHKPTAGILSLEGVYPLPMHALSDYVVCGVMSRYSVDLKPSLKVLAGEKVSELKLDNEVDFRKIKVYYMKDEGGFPFVRNLDKSAEDPIQKALDYFQQNYNIKPRKLQFPEMAHMIPCWVFGLLRRTEEINLRYEMTDGKFVMNPFIEFFKWIVRQSDFTIINILLGILEISGLRYIAKGWIGEFQIQKIEKVKKDLSLLLGQSSIFILPTHTRNGHHHYETIFFPADVTYTALANVTGFPSTQVPMGMAENGMPTGIQIMANRNNDHLTMAAAVELEKAFGGWVKPCRVSVEAADTKQFGEQNGASTSVANGNSLHTSILL